MILKLSWFHNALSSSCALLYCSPFYGAGFDVLVDGI